MRADLAVGASVALTLVFAALAVQRMRRDRILARVGSLDSSGSRSPRSRPRRGEILRMGRWLGLPAGGLAGMVVAGPPGLLAGAAAAFVIPLWRRRKVEERRRQQLELQLSDGVVAISDGLRAGHSLLQALRLSADGSEPPLRDALRGIVDRADMGAPLGDSLDSWVRSEPSQDVRLVSSVLKLHRRTGGDLPKVLDQLSRTLRERLSAAREVRSLTAQARMSGAILGFLPIGFFLFLSAISPEDMAAAYRSSAGATAIGVGVVLQLGAFIWIRNLLRVGV